VNHPFVNTVKDPNSHRQRDTPINELMARKLINLPPSQCCDCHDFPRGLAGVEIFHSIGTKGYKKHAGQFSYKNFLKPLGVSYLR
jgi:hypothetical protein